MLLYSLLAEVTPTPTPTMEVDPDLVTPGPIGFAAIALVVIFVVLLIADMQRRIRRTRYRDEVRAELDAEEAAARDGDSSAQADDEKPDSGDDTAK